MSETKDVDNNEIKVRLYCARTSLELSSGMQEVLFAIV